MRAASPARSVALGLALALSGCDDPALELPGNADGGADAGHLAQPVTCEDGIAEGLVTVASDTQLERLRGCRRVTGTLQLTGNLSRYDALAHLQRVGDLEVLGTTLPSFAVFEDLRLIDGSLVVRDNDRLVDVEALDRVAFGEPDDFTLPRIEFARNASLRRIEGLSALGDGHPRKLRVAQNPSLEALVVPAVPAWISVDVVQNAALTELELAGDVDATLSIVDNAALTNLHGLVVASVGELSVVDNLALLSVGDHPELVELSALTVVGGPELRDIGRFWSLEDVDTVTVQKVGAQARLDAFAPGTAVQRLRLEQLDHDSLEELRWWVQAEVSIVSLTAIASLGGLTIEPHLEAFSLEDSGLEHVDGLPELESALRLRVMFNTALDQTEVDAWCDDVIVTEFVGCSPNGGCPFTNNFVCDEPEGTGLCPEGTDFPDCGGLPLP